MRLEAEAWPGSPRAPAAPRPAPRPRAPACASALIGERLEPDREAVPLADRRGQLPGPCALAPAALSRAASDRERAVRRERHEVALVDERARRDRAASCAPPRGPRPRAGSRGRARPAARRRRRPRRSASHSSQAAANRASASASSAMRKPGTTPHSSGRSWSSCAHSAWIVQTLARSSTSSACATRSRSAGAHAAASARARSSRSRRRSFIVVAAFSVKVTAAISSSRAPPERTIASRRSTSSVVLPVPAPASTTRLERVVAAGCARGRPRRRAESRSSFDVPQPQVLLQRRVAAASVARRRAISGFGPHTAVKSHRSQKDGSCTNAPRAISETSAPSSPRKASPPTSSGRKATCRPPST